MATTQTRKPMVATPARWQTALRRAVAEGVQVRQLAGSGAWIATSGSDVTAAYLVSANGCECQAGEYGDPVCKHRAAYWHALGRLDLEPELAAVAPPTPESVIACLHCDGNGFDPTCQGHRITGSYTVHCPCSACDGAGTLADSIVPAERSVNVAA